MGYPKPSLKQRIADVKGNITFEEWMLEAKMPCGLAEFHRDKLRKFKVELAVLEAGLTERDNVISKL